MQEYHDDEREQKVSRPSEIDQIREELRLLKEQLLPDKLAKAVDSSYGRIRVFLQILAIIITIFLTGAIGFGFFGVTNVLSIHQEATEVHSLAEKVSQDQEQVENSLTSTKEMEGQIERKITDFNDTFQKTISDMRGESQKEILDLKTEVATIRESLDKTSDIFNRVAVKKRDVLNAREVQLLVLLAQEIGPDSPSLRFNHGYSAILLGRYDEAIEQLEAVLESQAVPPDLISKAQTLIAESKKWKQNPPKIGEVKSVKLGGYDILQIHVNTLEALRRNGYFTYEQAQKIINDAKAE